MGVGWVLMSFVDVPVGHWADEEVGWAVAGGCYCGGGWIIGLIWIGW